MYYKVLMNAGRDALKKGDNDAASRTFSYAQTRASNDEDKAGAWQMQAFVLRLGGKPVDASAAIKRVRRELASGAGTRQNLLWIARSVTKRLRW